MPGVSEQERNLASPHPLRGQASFPGTGLNEYCSSSVHGEHREVSAIGLQPDVCRTIVMAACVRLFPQAASSTVRRTTFGFYGFALQDSAEALQRVDSMVHLILFGGNI